MCEHLDGQIFQCCDGRHRTQRSLPTSSWTAERTRRRMRSLTSDGAAGERESRLPDLPFTHPHTASVPEGAPCPPGVLLRRRFHLKAELPAGSKPAFQRRAAGCPIQVFQAAVPGRCFGQHLAPTDPSTPVPLLLGLPGADTSKSSHTPKPKGRGL